MTVRKAPSRSRKERARVAEGLCWKAHCGQPRINSTSCLAHAKSHAAAVLARWRAKHPNARMKRCTECGRAGHNSARHDRARAAELT